MKKIFVFFVLVGNLSAQEINTGLSFLKLGIGARAVAMGEAFTGIASDHSSLYYNPATPRFAKSNEVMVMHKNWIAETTTEYLGATVLGKEFSYGFSAYTTSVPDIEVRTKPGPSEGTFSAQNVALGATVAYSIDEHLAVGVTGKMLYEKIFVDEATGYGIDIGFFRSSDDLSFGASVLHIGAMSTLKYESTKLPTTIRVGGSYRYNEIQSMKLTGAIDALQTLDDKITHFHFGIEGTYNDILSLRAGYKTGYEFSSITTGFGVMYGIVKFDYAFVPFTGGLSSTHTFSLSFLL
ncbi:MAG: PorV/PorQ family protein [Bacteroidota bacterium]